MGKGGKRGYGDRKIDRIERKEKREKRGKGGRRRGVSGREVRKGGGHKGEGREGD